MEYVRATIERYFKDRGFGFAITDETPPRKLYFNQNARFQIKQASGGPVLTDVREDVSALPPHSLILATIKQGDRGLYASSWGVLPADRWQDSLSKNATLQRYIDRSIAIQPPEGRVRCGLLTSITHDPVQDVLTVIFRPKLKKGYQLETTTIEYDISKGELQEAPHMHVVTVPGEDGLTKIAFNRKASL